MNTISMLDGSRKRGPRAVALIAATALVGLGLTAGPAFAGTGTTTTVTCTGAPVYDGTAQQVCTYSVVDGDTATEIASGALAAGDYSNNINAGTATASYSYAGDATYDPSSDTQTFTIAKADATVTCTPYDVPYDGSSHEADCTVTGTEEGGGATGVTVDTSGTVHTDAGSYTGDPWSLDGGTNYNNDSGTVDDNIDKATAIITVTPYDVTYDGSEHVATYSVTGVDEAGSAAGTSMDVSGTAHTSAGTYNGDAWSFDGGTNYNNDSGTVNDHIATTSVTGGTYTGAIAVPAGARFTLNSSFNIPTGCPTDVYNYEFTADSGSSWPWYTSTGNALHTLYTSDVYNGGLPAGAYDVRANYQGDSNCNLAYSDAPGFVVYDASTSAYGGGQYVNNGRANFAFEYHAANRVRPAGGNLVWNWKGQWRFKGKLAAYGKKTSGYLGGRLCTSTNPCGALSGSGSLFYFNGVTWVSVGNSIVVNVSAIQTTSTAKSSSPGYVGFVFGYTPVSGQPALPSNALISLQKSNNGGGGVISLK